MKKVREGLYIGNLEDATAVLSAAQTHITHVLNLIPPAQTKAWEVGRAAVDAVVVAPAEIVGGGGGGDEASLRQGNGGEASAKIVSLNVPMRDMETQNLLDNLEECLEFVEKGRAASGSVLVHCLAGVSRSAAVVMAYLMKTERLGTDDALDSLLEASEIVYPNAGFLQQLQMFEEMDFTVDRESPIYKKFHLEKLAEAYGRGEKILASRCAADPGGSAAGELPDSNSPQSNNGASGSETHPFTVYRCKKCRRLVASQGNVIVHSPGGGIYYAWKKKGGKHPGDDVSHPVLCTSIFVEPIQWMSSVLEGGMEGKLFCTNCQARLGNFNWAGMKCSCGDWVKPAFQLHKSKMDVAWL